MHIFQREQVEPVLSEHGEIIYALIGRDVGTPTNRHSIAFVVLPPGKSSLLHFHPEAEESYYILSGSARMAIGDEATQVQAGQAILIPSNQPHQITNIGSINLEFLAICVPAWEPNNSVYIE